MSDTLTVDDVARLVDKSLGYVRQHIHRGHLKSSKNEAGRVVIDPNDAREWALARNLDFGAQMDMSSKTHALIMPFPVANLVTWCGYRIDSRALRGDFIADSPESVTCQRCMTVMREAQKNLETWTPRLSVREET